MTVCSLWNGWIQEAHAKHSAEFQWSIITNSREDRHNTSMALMYRTSTSGDLSQEMGRKTISVFTTSSKTFAATYFVNLATMASTILDVTSKPQYFMTSSFQKTLDSVYNMMMVIYVFGSIIEYTRDILFKLYMQHTYTHGRIIKWTQHISKKRGTTSVLHDGKNDVTSMSLFGC